MDGRLGSQDGRFGETLRWADGLAEGVARDGWFGGRFGWMEDWAERLAGWKVSLGRTEGLRRASLDGRLGGTLRWVEGFARQEVFGEGLAQGFAGRMDWRKVSLDEWFGGRFR